MSTTTTHSKTKTLVPQLRFSEFDGAWNQRKLRTLSTLITKGTTPKRFTETGVNFVKIEGLEGININKEKCLYIDENIHENELKRSALKLNDLLFAIAGATIGKVGIVTEDILPANTNQALAIIRLENPNYLNYILQILQSSVMKKYIHESISVGAQPNLNLEQMGDFQFFIPSLPELQKIAAFLSAVDDKIQQLSRKKALLEQYKKGVMQQIFTQQIRFKDENGNSYPDWEEKRLGDYLIKHSEVATENDQYPVLTSSRRGLFFQKDYFNGQDVASKDTTGYNVVPRGYFTYRHMSDDLDFKFNINHLCDRGIVSTLYPVFTTKEDLDDSFLVLKLNNGKEFQKYAILQKQGGSRTYMYFKKLELLKIKLPCLEEQKKIAEFVTKMEMGNEEVENQIAQIQTFKKGLLQKMFV